MSRVQMTRLGKMGRWGNQLLEYAFLKTYAARLEATLELPRWVGTDLFQTDDQPLSLLLPEYHEPVDRANQPLWPKPPNAILDHDFVGYGQVHTGGYKKDEREYIWSILDPELLSAHDTRLDDAQAELYEIASGKTLVGIHIRRGDFGQLIFPFTPVEWYLRQLEKLYPDPDAVVLFVASEDTGLVAACSKYEVVTTQLLGIDLSAKELPGYNYLDRDLVAREPHQLDFLPDWYLLSQCDTILGGNSTFSFTAAMLNPCLDAYYRSSLKVGGFELVDPWSAYPLLRESVDDYPNLEGIKVESNAYWPGPRLRTK